MDAESVVLNYLRSGPATAPGFVAARDECKRRMNELGKSLKARAAALAKIRGLNC